MSTKPLRIIALPLIRQRLKITHFHYQINFPPKPSESQSNVQKAIVFAQRKAAETWKGFGDAPPGGWKNRLFVFGERQIDKLQFEELSLGSIDSHPPTDLPKIPIYYPKSLYSDESTVLSELKTLVSERLPLHRQGFWRWGIAAPFTAPFALVPVIPNIPFFFCVWRSYNHYRAYKSSDLLLKLLTQDAITPTPSATLDAIYAARSKKVSGTQDEDLMLTLDDLPELSDAIGMDSALEKKDVERAISQVNVRRDKAVEEEKAKTQ